ncbi:MAG: DUF4235 domain-containing protein [Aeromicrobium sp.]|uniref:DUF4235 domain-containing protein n=1 Tax=Aeromicrobium sp. TaxID=1871063 RepID=UPI0039E66506
MAKRRKRQRKTEAEATASGAAKSKRGGKAAWKLMDKSTTMAAGIVAPVVAAGGWRLVTGKRPPAAADNPEIDTREAILWALVGGALVEAVKVAVRRRTAQYWVDSTGALPPGMKTLVDSGDQQQTPSA